MRLQCYLRNSPHSRHTFRVQNAGSGHGLTGSSVNRETSASERGRAPVESPEVLAMSALSLQNWLSAGFPSLLPMSWVCVAGTTSQCSWPSNAVLPWHGCPLCCPIAPIKYKDSPGCGSDVCWYHIVKRSSMSALGCIHATQSSSTS